MKKLLILVMTLIASSSLHVISTRGIYPSKIGSQFTSRTNDQSLSPSSYTTLYNTEPKNIENAPSVPSTTSDLLGQADSSYPVQASYSVAGSLFPSASSISTAPSFMSSSFYSANPASSIHTAAPSFHSSALIKHNQYPIRQSSETQLKFAPDFDLPVSSAASLTAPQDTKSNIPFSILPLSPTSYESFSEMNPQVTLDVNPQASDRISGLVSSESFHFAKPAETGLESQTFDLYKGNYPA